MNYNYCKICGAHCSHHPDVNGVMCNYYTGYCICAKCENEKVTFDSVFDSVCENCGAPCIYHPDYCLCEKCEKESGQK